MILTILSFVMVGCDDDKDEVFAPDLSLFAGTWEVVDPGDQKVFGWNEMLYLPLNVFTKASEVIRALSLHIS